MTAATAGWLIPAIVGAAGVGVGVAGQVQAAKQSQNIARYNYAMQMQAARQQNQMQLAQQSAMNQQAGLMEAQAAINNSLAQSEAQARLNNADALRTQAESQATTDRQNIMATKRDQDRQIAIMRARIGKQNTVESLSAADLLAEAGGEMQRVLEDQQYQSDIQRRQTLGSAAMEEFGAKLDSAGATAGLNAGNAEADFTRMSAALEGAKGAAALAQGRREAKLSLLTGESNARGLRMSAMGSLISGVSSVGGAAWTSWRNGGTFSGFGNQTIGSYFGASRPSIASQASNVKFRF